MADVDDTGDLEIEDEREYRLQDLVRSGESFVFGDSWGARGPRLEGHFGLEDAQGPLHCWSSRVRA